MENKIYDILIIGAGPAGISMAVEAVHAGVNSSKIILVEKESEHSFSIKKYYPGSKLVTANYKGAAAKCNGVMCIPDLTKEEAITYLDKAIIENYLAVNYNESVWKICRDDKGIFTIHTDKREYRTKIVAVAIGILGRPNKPEYKIPTSLKDLVLFDITSKEINDSRILVVGGGDSASEYCQFLSARGNKITLSYRKQEFSRMNEINFNSLIALEKENKVKILFNTNIESVKEVSGKPYVEFREPEFAPADFDFIVYALGGTTPKNFLKSLNIRFEGDEPMLGEHHETSVQGLYLLGDLAAGTRGGSIIGAFNSSGNAIKQICRDYLDCNPSMSV